MEKIIEEFSNMSQQEKCDLILSLFDNLEQYSQVLVATETNKRVVPRVMMEIFLLLDKRTFEKKDGDFTWLKQQSLMCVKDNKILGSIYSDPLSLAWLTYDEHHNEVHFEKLEDGMEYIKNKRIP